MTEYLVDTSQKVFANKFVQEIIRCRSCLYLANPSEVRWCAKLATHIPDADGYCAWGERRETWITCKCGEEMEDTGGEYIICPSCGRKVML